ncbi:MAG: hypothetical protein NVS3B12_23690 [Acidimicrobiales bacterium]
MGEFNRVQRRRVARVLAGAVVAGLAAGCSSPGSHRISPVIVAPTTTDAPIPEQALKSLGPRLTSGPPAPPTTSSLNRPAPTASKGPTAAVSQTHDPATPDCPAGDLTASAATDQPSYADGATVTITVAVSNAGAGVCQYQPAISDGGAIVQTATSGGVAARTVWEARRTGATAPAAPYYRLEPGQKVTVVSVTWDQRSCPPPCTGPEGDRPPRGSYRAVPQLSGMGTVRFATFALT